MKNQLIFSLILLFTSTTFCIADDVAKEKAIVPDKVIKVFNGKDLDGLYTWMRDTKYEDPRQIFTVKDGILHISGDGYGGVITKNNYKNYHVIVEYRWGDKTWGARVDKTKDSGLLVHGVGRDGGYGNTWLHSIEAQIIEGGVGDFILVRGTNEDGTHPPMSMDAKVVKDRDGENCWSEEGELKTFHSGRINWYGRDPDWKDVLGFRGMVDVESPGEEWTTLEVICDGDKVTNIVNGVKVNEGTKVVPSYGKILIQTEMAELYVRKWEIWPVGKAPKYTK
jgi:3-keto-disaccharide hydrolase